MSNKAKATNTQTQSPTPSPSSRRFSVQDMQLEKYIYLDTQVKALTKERDAIKDILKHKGTHSTSHFACIVETRTRTNPPSLKALEAEYGPQVKDLCTVSEFQQVKVSPKGGA